MVKLIPTLERTLNAKIDRLTADYERVKSENERLRAENTRLSKMAYGRNASVKALVTKALAPTTTPSYLQPTVASKLRAKGLEIPQEATDEHEDDRSPFYEQGRLVRVNGKPALPNYMLSTQASSSKERCSAGWGTFESQGDPMLQIQTAAEEVESPIATELECFLYIRPDNPNSLASRSRLKDCSWHGPSEDMLHVPFRIQHRLLSAAHRIAQDCLFDAARKFMPGMREHLGSSPREMRLGRDELLNTFGREITIPSIHGLLPPSKGSKHLTSSKWDVTDEVLRLVALRNAVCHPTSCNSEIADDLLTRVQKLAITFDDSRRALKVRKLRDQLRDEARKVQIEIESIYALRSLEPSARQQWRAHHKETFRDVLGAKTYSVYGEKALPDYSLIVRSAAWDWDFARKSCQPRPDDEAQGESAQFARLTLLGHRHNSMSGNSSELMFDKQQVQKQATLEADWARDTPWHRDNVAATGLDLKESVARKEKKPAARPYMEEYSEW